MIEPKFKLLSKIWAVLWAVESKHLMDEQWIRKETGGTVSKLAGKLRHSLFTMQTTCSCFVLDWGHAMFNLESITFQFSQALKSEGKTGQGSEFSATHRDLQILKTLLAFFKSLIKFITKRWQELDGNVPPPSGERGTIKGFTAFNSMLFCICLCSYFISITVVWVHIEGNIWSVKHSCL